MPNSCFFIFVDKSALLGAIIYSQPYIIVHRPAAFVTRPFIKIETPIFLQIVK